MKSLFLLSILLLPLSVSRAWADGREALKPGDTLASCVTADPDSAYIFKPHCEETITRAGATSKMSYNALGLRDADYPPSPKPGWKRILLVGASSMVGPGLDEKDTPPRRLEKYLGGAKKKIELINAGVEGYSPLLASTRIKAWLQAYHPTHVVIDVDFGSSSAADLMYAGYLESDESGSRKVHVQIAGWMKPIASLFGIDTTQYAGQRKVITWQSATHRALHSIRCRLTNFTKQTLSMCMVKDTLDSLAYLRKESLAAGAKVITMFAPGGFQNDLILNPSFDPAAFAAVDRFTPRLSLSSAPVAAFFKKRNIPFQSLIPIRGDDLTLPGDYHFNVAGADLFARGAMLRLQAFLGE